MTMNIAETLNRVAAQLGDKPGLIEAKTGKTLSFHQLNSLSDGYATLLSERGIRPGGRVMLMVKPSADFICLTFALFKIGATIILIDPGMGYKNLLRCIEGVSPTVLIGIPKALLFAAIFRRPFSTVNNTFCCGNSFGFFGKDIRGMVQAEVPSFPVYTPSEYDLAAIIFTTGSTGPPKGVRYEHSIFAAQLERIRDYYKIDSNHVDQPAFPLFALFSASLGACSVIPDMDPTRPAKVDPEKFIASINLYGVTYSFGSPAIWNVVSRYCQERKIVLKSLKKVLMAGAPVPGELLERVMAILPHDAEVFTPYGATECLPIVSIEGHEIVEKTWPETQKGKGVCVGRPLPGIDIRIMRIAEDAVPVYDSSREMEAGQIGEIIVCGNVVTRAYENNALETTFAKIYSEDKKRLWHRMGDIGFVDNEGLLWFCGRKAHRVITEKDTLYTIQCESIVNVHPDVSRSALVGVPIRETVYSRPVLIIEPQKGYKGKLETLLNEVKALANASRVTSEITDFLVHRDFPVDIRHNAKIFREKLAVWAAEQLGGK